MHLSIIKKSLKNYYFYLKQTENRLIEIAQKVDITGDLNDTRLEMRFIEKELGLEKHQFIDIDSLDDEQASFLEDDDEFDYTGVSCIKAIENQNLAEINVAKEVIENNQNGLNDNFKSLISQPINEHYSWGRYGKFNIILKNDNAYVNASFLIEEALKYENVIREKAMIKKLNKKPFNEWKDNLETKALLVSTKIKIGLSEDKLIIDLRGKKKRGEEMLQGYFIHPILVNSLATWVSPSYALEINEVINQLKIDEKLKADRKRIRELTDDCSNKDDLIYKLTELYNNISSENKILIENSRIAILKIDQVNEKLDQTNKKLEQTNEKLDTGISILKSLKNNIKLETKDKFCDIVLIIQVFNFGTFDCYKVLRTTYENLNRAYQYHNDNNERINCILAEETVNSTQAFKKFVDENTDKVTGKLTKLTLKPGYTEKKLLKDFRKMLGSSNKIIDKFIKN